MSFVGAVMRGLLIFTVMTASVAVALFFAVTGPPSNDEMRGLRTVASQALAQFEDGTRKLGDAVCTQLPHKLRVAAECVGADDAPVEQADATPPPATPLPPDTTVPLPPVQVAQAAPPDDGRLLGADPSAVAVSVPVVLAHRAVSARRPHARATHAAVHRQRPASAHRQLTSRRAHTPPRRRLPPTPIVTHHQEAPARATPVVEPARTPPPIAQPAVAIPHPQRATPEPRVAAAPASAAPIDDTPAAEEPPPEKHDPNQTPTF
ncbi:MAG: hypothetical protein QM759_16955 [Terricaulis sp.]